MQPAASLMQKASLALLNLIIPERCVGCDREGEYLCAGCAAELPPLRKPYCFICASPGVPQLCYGCRRVAPAFDSVRAPYEYSGAVRQMAHDLKYRNIRIAAPYMARLLAAYLERNPYPADALIAVPLHRWRERGRGYNQSALLARELSQLSDIPLREDALRRIRNTPPQVGMESPAERRRNIAEAFECAADMSGQRIIMIDDVATTGSTLSACADALKNEGALSVWGIAFARQSALPSGYPADGDAPPLWI